jgi:hypothetical protein
MRLPIWSCATRDPRLRQRFCLFTARSCLIQEWKDGVRVGGREGVQINMKSGVFWNIWSIFTSGGSLLEYDRNSEKWLEMLMKWTM